MVSVRGDDVKMLGGDVLERRTLRARFELSAENNKKQM